MSAESKCPVVGGSRARTHRRLVAEPAEPQGSPPELALADPMGEDFDYAKEFKSLDLDAVIKDLHALMTDSQDWWPADFGHYGPLFIRMAWHSAGTYRIHDGRGGAGDGQQRFAPLNSWPDNANLDKARRLLWPIKQKYGRKISWADLLILTGNVALESMGFKTFGFGGGRADSLGARRIHLLGSRRRVAGGRALLRRPRAAESPRRRADGPDLRQSGRAERQAGSGRCGQGHPRDVQAHGDERRGDRRADCRRPHLRQDPRRRPMRRSIVGPEPEGATIEEQGFGWKNKFGTGKGDDAITSGLEVTWTATPTKWSNNFFYEPVRLRMGADQEPGRRVSVEAEEWRGRRHGAGCARQVEAPLALDADDGPRACGSTRPTRRSRGASSSIRISSRTRSPARGSSSRTATWVRSCATSARSFRRRR